MEISRQTSRGDDVFNEVDVAFLSGNRLHVIECKTNCFDERDDGEGNGAQSLYKLDTIKDLLGGASGKAMLISYRRLSKYDLQRAADLVIETCAGKDLQELPCRLRRWIEES